MLLKNKYLMIASTSNLFFAIIVNTIKIRKTTTKDESNSSRKLRRNLLDLWS